MTYQASKVCWAIAILKHRSTAFARLVDTQTITSDWNWLSSTLFVFVSELRVIIGLRCTRQSWVPSIDRYASFDLGIDLHPLTKEMKKETNRQTNGHCWRLCSLVVQLIKTLPLTVCMGLWPYKFKNPTPGCWNKPQIVEYGLNLKIHCQNISWIKLLHSKKQGLGWHELCHKGTMVKKNCGRCPYRRWWS